MGKFQKNIFVALKEYKRLNNLEKQHLSDTDSASAFNGKFTIIRGATNTNKGGFDQHAKINDIIGEGSGPTTASEAYLQRPLAVTQFWYFKSDNGEKWVKIKIKNLDDNRTQRLDFVKAVMNKVTIDTPEEETGGSTNYGIQASPGAYINQNILSGGY